MGFKHVDIAMNKDAAPASKHAPKLTIGQVNMGFSCGGNGLLLLSIEILRG